MASNTVTSATYHVKTDEQYFPCLFGKESAIPKEYEKFESALKEIAQIGRVRFSYQKYIERKTTVEKFYDENGKLIYRKKTVEDTPVNTYEDRKAASEKLNAHIIRYDLQFEASMHTRDKIDKFPPNVYDVPPAFLDDGNMFDVGEIDLLDECGDWYDPYYQLKDTFKAFKSHVCNRPNFRILSVLAFLFMTIQYMRKGLSLFEELPMFLAQGSDWLSRRQDLSVTLGAVFLFAFFLIFAGYDLVKLTSKFFDFFGFGDGITYFVLGVEGLTLLASAWTMSFAYFFPHLVSKNPMLNQQHYDLLKYLHMDRFVLIVFVVLLLLEIIRAIHYVYLQQGLRAEYIEDMERYRERFFSVYDDKYRTYRFFVLWGKQAGKTVPPMDAHFKNVLPYYDLVQPLIDKQKTKKQRVMWTIPDSFARKARGVGMKVENFLFIASVVATVALIGFIVWKSRDYLKEASGYNAYVAEQEVEKEKEEKLLTFRADYYDDYFVSSKDANAMESSGDVFGSCQYDSEGKSLEQLHVVMRNQLVNAWLNGEDDGNITDLGGEKIYGLLNGGYESYAFGKNRILYCRDGAYEKYDSQNWLTEYKSLDWDVRCDYLFDILMKQNVKNEERFSAEEVAFVSYAKTDGTLIRFVEDGKAYFVKQDGNTLQVYTQTEPGKRDLLFEVNDYSYKGKGYKYFLVHQFFFYVNDNKLMFYDYLENKTITFLENDQTINHVNFLHDENGEMYVCFSDDEKLYIHNFDRNQGVQVREDFNYKDIQGIYSAGEYFVYFDSKALTSREHFEYKNIHVTPDLIGE